MKERTHPMESPVKPYVHLAINAVDAVAFDPEGRYDADHYDRYPTFNHARDAALSSIELMLDAGDYDGEDHKEELERMLRLLESASSYDDLEAHPEYHSFLKRREPAQPIAL